MNRNILIYTLLILNIVLLQAKPILTKNKYLISTQYDSGVGTVSPGNGIYPLVYNDLRSEADALETDYWVIKNISGNNYTFQNASTGQYIRYNPSAADRLALELVNGLQPDNSTSFILEHMQVSGLSYYVIHSALNAVKVWNRRTVLYSSVYAVGVYTGERSSNELFIFYDSNGNPAIDDGQVTAVLPTAMPTLGSFSNDMVSLTFNGKTPVADTPYKEFYLSIPDSLMSVNQTMQVRYTPKNPDFRLYIDNMEVTSGSSFVFSNVSAAQKYTLEIRSGNTVITSGTLYFSGLPFVQIYSDATIGSVYSLCRIAVTDPLKTDSTEVLLAKMKIRGKYSTQFNKKAYAINIRDSTGVNSANRTFLGMRNDNNWVLDAMYIDPGRMRNRVSADLWNDFATKPYWHMNEFNMQNGYSGRFVEVFMNDAYRGLYHMCEKVDRKQLNLGKLRYSMDSTEVTQRGELYKGSGWSIGTMFGYGPINDHGGIPDYNNASETWELFECKYPELDEGEPIDWKPLYDAVHAASYLTSDNDFRTKIPDLFDLPVFADYYLFVELMLATDNHGKNMFFSIYDQSVSKKMSATPWDLDATWGIRWDQRKDLTYAAQDYDSYVKKYENGHLNLYLRLKSLDLNGWHTTVLKNRYKELRGNHFSYENLMGRFQKYSDLFIKSGAAAREQEKWNISPISQEMTFLSDWIRARLNFLDIHYLGAPYTTVANIQTNKIHFSPNPVENWLKISGLQSGQIVYLYTLQGVFLDSKNSSGNTLQIDMARYKPGMYIIKVDDYTSKIVCK